MNTTPKRLGILGTSLGFGVAAVWIGFWTLGTLAFDIGIVRSFIAQVRALGYPTADGVVTASEVEIEHDSDGSTYTPQVAYLYSVARQELTGHRLQYQWSSFGPREARRIVAQYPPGTAVKVYYNPRDPSDSLLLPGLDSGHALIVLFMLPFNIVMLGCWMAVWFCLRGTEGRLPWIVRAKRTPEGLTLRLPDYSPLTAAAIYAAVASIAGDRKSTRLNSSHLGISYAVFCLKK